MYSAPCNTYVLLLFTTATSSAIRVISFCCSSHIRILLFIPNLTSKFGTYKKELLNRTTGNYKEGGIKKAERWGQIVRVSAAYCCNELDFHLMAMTSTRTKLLNRSIAVRSSVFIF